MNISREKQQGQLPKKRQSDRSGKAPGPKIDRRIFYGFLTQTGTVRGQMLRYDTKAVRMMRN